MAKRTPKPQTKHIGHYSLQEALEMSQEEFDSIVYSEFPEAEINIFARTMFIVQQNSAVEKLAKKILPYIEILEENGFNPEVLLAAALVNHFDGDIQD